MDEMLNRVLELIGDKHGAGTDLARFLGIHPNVVTNWRNGRNKSYITHLDEIADYFGATVEYLKTGQQKKATLSGDLSETDKTILSLFGELSPPEKEKALAVLQALVGRQ